MTPAPLTCPCRALRPPARSPSIRVRSISGRRSYFNQQNVTIAARFRYQWLRNGARIGGATAQALALTDADVGARFSCRLRATAPGGTQTVVSPDSRPTAALDLSLLPGGMVDEGVCRAVSAPALLPGAVHMVFRNPITPWALLLVHASSATDVTLDRRALGSSTNVKRHPEDARALWRWASHNASQGRAQHRPSSPDARTMPAGRQPSGSPGSLV